MRATYKPKPRYICAALSKTHAGPQCLHLEGAGIEGAVLEAFFAALAPAELDLLDAVLAAEHLDRARLQRQHTEQVQRAEYEVRLAERQYLAVDPDNRLVAAELERRWEQALQALAAAREAAAAVANSQPVVRLDPALRAQLRDLGPQMPALWRSGRLSAVQQKELLRSLIRRVILTRPVPDRVEVKIVWISGAFSHFVVQPPLQRTRDLGDYERLTSRLRELSDAGYADEEIARYLAAEGFRGARSEHLSPDMVGRLRRADGHLSLRTQFRRQAQIDGCWTIAGLAQHLGVHRRWLYTQIEGGMLPARRHPSTGNYLIPDTPDLLAQLQAAAQHANR